LNRREFLRGTCAAGVAATLATTRAQTGSGSGLAFRFADVTASAGIHFQHNSGAYGGKLLPETLGSGCAFLDYDADGW
jgi:enediyne biosynthesis protein E4